MSDWPNGWNKKNPDGFEAPGFQKDKDKKKLINNDKDDRAEFLLAKKVEIFLVWTDSLPQSWYWQGIPLPGPRQNGAKNQS